MSDGDPAWYVVAREPKEGDFHVDVWGPFRGEIDARAFALDVGNEEEGFEYIEPELLMPEKAAELATKEVLWPYTEEEL